MNIFSSIKQWLNSPRYSLGHVRNYEDNRDVRLAVFQAPVTIPVAHKSDISMLPEEDQRHEPSCVGEAIMKLLQLYGYKKTGQIIKLSARFIYAIAKQFDGYGGYGTYPRIGAKVAIDYGCATTATVLDDTTLLYDEYVNVDLTVSVVADAAPHKVAGYATVELNLPAISQAIYQNGAVTAAFDVDFNWFLGIIKKVTKPLGSHYTFIFGYDEEGLYGLNSWGSSWMGIKLNKILGPGQFYVSWADYKDNIYDVLAFTDIPVDVLEKAKTTPYYFRYNLYEGMHHPDVVQLQKLLNQSVTTAVALTGPGSKGQETTYFGELTREALVKFQIKNRIYPSAGFFGPITRAFINESVPGAKRTLVDAMIMVESGGDDNAEGDKNLVDHAYGCLQIRQGVVDDVNARMGTNHRSQNCLGNRALSLEIFNNYWLIYPENNTDEDKARAWNGGPGWRRVKLSNPTYTDGYWAKVKALL